MAPPQSVKSEPIEISGKAEPSTEISVKTEPTTEGVAVAV